MEYLKINNPSILDSDNQDPNIQINNYDQNHNPEDQDHLQLPKGTTNSSSSNADQVGRTSEEKNLRKIMKNKLKTTEIKDIILEGEQTFNSHFDYIKSLGYGGFGFVVHAVYRKTGEEMALKVSHSPSNGDKPIDQI